MAKYYMDKNGNVTSNKNYQSTPKYNLDENGNITQNLSLPASKKKPKYMIDANGNVIATEEPKKEKAVVSSKKKKKDEDSWFKSGAFGDGKGNFFTDALATIGSTVADVGVGITKGVSGLAEGVVDLGMYGVAGAADLLGADKFAKGVKKTAQKSFTNKVFDPANEAVSTYSVLGNKSDAVTQGLGQVAGILLTGGAGAAAGLGTVGTGALVTGTNFISSFGSGISEAYEGGASDKEAVIYGAIKGGIDAGTEMLFGGLGKAVNATGISSGLGGFDDMLADYATRKLTNQVVKNAAKYGLKAAGEGVEEILAGVGTAFAKQATYMDEKEINELLEDENLLDQFITGALVGGIASAPSAVQSTVAGRDYTSGLTANEQKVVDAEVESRIAEQEANGQKLTKKEQAKIKEQVQKDLKSGSISTDTIERTLFGENDTYKNYQSITKQETALNKKIEDIKNDAALTTAQKNVLTKALKAEVEALNKSQMQGQLMSGIDTLTERDTYLRESYNEKGRRSQAFEADLSKYDDKQKDVIQRAIDSGILNNTNRTHEFVDMVAKISSDKGVSFDFANNESLKNSGFAIDGATINGYVKDGNIVVNIQSNKALNTIVGHEVTHILEGTELYTELQDMIIEYAKTKGDYQSRYDALAKLYEGVEGADINNELTADLVGDYLFTDSDFINNLSVQKPNVFKRIYEQIKYLLKIATGSKETKQLEQVKRAFDKAYKQSNATTDNDVRYSLEKTSDGTEYVKAESDIFVKKDGTLASEREVFNALEGKTIHLADGDVKIVKNLPKKGMYNELFKRQPKTLKGVEGVKELNQNVNYHFEELLTNSTMKTDNVPDANDRHKEQTITAFDTRTVKFYDGSKVYDVEFSIGILENGEKVAYAKKFFGYDEETTKKIQTTETRGSSNTPMNQQSVNDIVPQNTKKSSGKVEFSISEDTQGRKLSKEQQEFFKDSKAVDENGKLVTVYHGSPDYGFTVFDRNKTDDKLSFFFTNDDDMANTYVGDKNKLYEVYLNITNPYVVDAKGHKWNQIRLDENDDVITGKAERFVDLSMRYDVEIDFGSVAESLGYLSDSVEYMLQDEMENLDEGETSLYTDAEKEELRKLAAEIDEAYETWDEEAHLDEDGEPTSFSQYLRDHQLSTKYTTRMIAKIAKENGNDGVIIKNVYDNGKFHLQTGIQGFGDVYIAFEPNQIKRVDNVTPTSKEDIRYSLSSDEIKAKQLDIILNANPANDSYHTWIRSKDDILTYEEALNSSDYVDYKGEDFDESYPYSIAEEALKTGKITVYSSYPIEQGIFVSPSKMEAQMYAGNGKIYSKKVDLSDVAWIDPTQGQYAKVDTTQRSLSNQNQDIAPVGSYNVYGRDIALETTEETPVEDIAPVREVAELPTPLTEEMANERDAQQQNIDTLVDAPEEIEAPYYSKDEDIKLEDPFEERDIKDVGNRKVKAYMYDNPEVKPYFQQEAQAMLWELQNSVKGEKNFNSQLYYDTNGELGWFGTTRETSDDIAYLLDNFKYTYADIEKGLKAIIEDHGAENNAISKRIEFALNDRLKDGYTDFMSGEEVPANQDYVNLLMDKQINTYSDEAYYEWLQSLANEEAPPLAPLEPSTDEIAPVREDFETPEGTQRVMDFENNQIVDEEEAPKRKTHGEIQRAYVENIKKKFEESGLDFDTILEKAKNKSTFSSVDNTPQRYIEKTLGYKEGQILNDLTINQEALNESKGIKWLNSFTNRKNGELKKLSKKYGIKPNSKEDAAAQMYAEGFYVNDNNEVIGYGDNELAKDFPDVKTQERIKGLAKDPRIREIYDNTLDQINESRTRNGYFEIPRRDNYFLHFRAMDDTFSKLGIPFNPNDIRAKDLPTDINGMTADLKPNQPYFASANQRKGLKTSHSLLGGMERYLTSAKNQIYHIDDIMTLRGLRNYIADMYGQAHGLESLDTMTPEEAEARIKEVYDAHLSTFAKFLNEQANVLAGKTSLIDRGLEGIIGRRGIQTLNTINTQVAKNMVGFNVSSALTNFVGAVQGFAKANKFDAVKALAQMTSNKIGSIFGKSDGFAENDLTMIRRKGADKFYRTPIEKVSDIGYTLMSGVDNITSEFLIRAKYNELTRKGMNSEKAHIEAGKWAMRILGDRSLGQQPQLYNSKMLGLITKFQLEVRNQLDSMFYDTVQEANVDTETIKNGTARSAKKAAKITSTMVQLAVLQHLFGKAFESVAGYNPAFDIVNVFTKLFGFDDEEEDDDTALDNVEQAFLELVGDMPYSSIFTGGRIPIESALPIAELVKGEDEYGNEKSRVDILKEAAPYWLNPIGGTNQIKKTIKGLNMFDESLPVAGSYTDSGNLRFPVEDTASNRLQAAIFGQWANENARDYINNERQPLKEKQIQEFADLDIPIQEYWEYREGLKEQKTIDEKFDYIAGLDLPVSKKNILINNVVDREEKVDLINYDDFSGYEEFDFATKNPEKYEFFKNNNISYADYSASEESKEAYSWAYNNPEKYVVSKAIGNVVQYKQYSKDLNKIEADKDEEGKSISGSRKEKVISYINNMDADYGAKIILYKSEYPSDDTYNMEIVDYLNNRSDITYEEMTTILTELGFTVEADGTVRWE